jgi:putative oxidoreductase
VTWLRHPAVHRAAGVLLGAVFLYASLDKIAQPAEFARIVYHYQVIGPSARLGYVPANLLAVALPWTEAVAGVLLIAGVWRREAAAVVGVLLVAFLAAVGSALLRGIDIENCGCFTVDGAGRRAGLWLMLGDAALLAVSALLAAAPARPEPARAETPEGALTLPVGRD